MEPLQEMVKGEVPAQGDMTEGILVPPQGTHPAIFPPSPLPTPCPGSLGQNATLFSASVHPLGNEWKNRALQRRLEGGSALRECRRF